MTHDRLSLVRRRMRGHSVITAVGSIDRHTVPQLRSTLLQTLTRHGPHVVLDLSAVDHLDDVGADALRRTARRATALGGHLRLVVPHGSVTQAVHDAGLPWCMRVTGTLADALIGPVNGSRGAAAGVPERRQDDPLLSSDGGPGAPPVAQPR